MSSPSPDCRTVAVRTLCEFTARRGDLDLRFTPSPTGPQGIAGHQLVTGRRGAGYEREVSLSAGFGSLTVRGRADGFDPAAGRLDEIKTHRSDLARQPANHRHLHWAQAKVYGWMLCQARGLASVRLALVYLDLGSQKETVFEEEHEAQALRGFFEGLCGQYIAWAEQEAAHRTARDAALGALDFPHAAFRTGQRELAENAWRAARSGRCLMAQAPTGIGKTVGTLYPVLKAAAQGLDRVFYLAARTPGRQLGIDALERLRSPGPGAARVLELTAREKLCEHPDKACHGDSCPLARGFYDRLPAARAAALAAPSMALAPLREAALAHEVCPYWLAQEMARWADVVVGDYNYFFDSSALLHALTVDQGWRCAILVDEAHNLVERGRQMYTGELDERRLAVLRRSAPAALRKPLDRLARSWRELVRDQQDTFAVQAELPGRFVLALQQASTAIGDHLVDAPTSQPQVDESGDRPGSLPGDLQQFHFELLAFLRLAETFGDHSQFDITLAPAPRRVMSRLCIRNLVPAPHLAPRFQAAQGAVLFSATLGPSGYYRDMLGLPADSVWIDIESPFTADQLAVHVMPRISTRWADRERSVAPIAELIARQFAQRPGNYLAFFSSYDYLRRVAAHLGEFFAQVPQWVQEAGMTEAQRQAFIARFVPAGAGVGFAVLGGSFGEGIDLPGDRLVGAFIATLGLPQVNPVNECLRQRLQSSFGAGFDYAYLYPGLRKVVQAAGRVIRSQDDRGVVWLIDDRFAQPGVRALLPKWWHVQGIAPPAC